MSGIGYTKLVITIMTTKAKYIDGFIVVVKTENNDAYKKIAKRAGKMWMKHGALAYKECMLEDKDPMPEYKVPTFIKTAKAKDDETVWFSYIEYKNKKHRDQVNKKVMEEMEEKGKKDASYNDMPFEMKKMTYGGFTTEVSL